MLFNKNSQLIAREDDAEPATVRENFLKKKLALTNSYADLHAAIKHVCTSMNEDRFKSRSAFYYCGVIQ